MKWVVVLLFMALAISGLPALNLGHSQSSATETDNKEASRLGLAEVSKEDRLSLKTASLDEQSREQTQPSSLARPENQGSSSHTQSDSERRLFEDAERNRPGQDSQSLSSGGLNDLLLQSHQTSRRGDETRNSEEYNRDNFNSYDRNGGNTHSVDSFSESGNQYELKSSYDKDSYRNLGLDNGGLTDSRSGSRSTSQSEVNNAFKRNQRVEEESSQLNGSPTVNRKSLSGSNEESKEFQQSNPQSAYYNQEQSIGRGSPGLLNSGGNQDTAGQYNIRNLLGSPGSPADFQRGPVQPVRQPFIPTQGSADSPYNQNRNYGSDNGNYGSHPGNYAGQHTPNLGSYDGRHLGGIWNLGQNNDQLLRRAEPQLNNQFGAGFQGANPVDYINRNHGIDIPRQFSGSQPSGINEFFQRVPNQIPNQGREAFSDTLLQAPNKPVFNTGTGNQGIDSGKYLNALPLSNRLSPNSNEFLNGLLNHARAAVPYPGTVNPGNTVNRDPFQGVSSNVNQYPIETEDANTKYISDILSKALNLLKHGALPNGHGGTPVHLHPTAIIEPVYEVPNQGIRFYEAPTGSYIANPSSVKNDEGFREVVPEYVMPAIIVPETNAYSNSPLYTPNYSGYVPAVEYLPASDGISTIFGRNPAYNVVPASPINTIPVNNDRSDLLVDRALTYAPLPPLAPAVPLTPLGPVQTFDNVNVGPRGDTSGASVIADAVPAAVSAINTIPVNNDRPELLVDRALTYAPLPPLAPVVPLTPLASLTPFDNVNVGPRGDTSGASVIADAVPAAVSPINTIPVTNDRSELLVDRALTYGPLPPLSPVVPLTPLAPLKPFRNVNAGPRGDASDASAIIADAAVSPINTIPVNNDRSELLVDRTLTYPPLASSAPVVPLTPLTPVTPSNSNEDTSGDASTIIMGTELPEYDTTYGPTKFDRDLKFANTHGIRYPVIDGENQQTSTDVNDGLLDKPVNTLTPKIGRDDEKSENTSSKITNVTRNNENTVVTNIEDDITTIENSKTIVINKTRVIENDEDKREQTIERIKKDLNINDTFTSNDVESIKNSTENTEQNSNKNRKDKGVEDKTVVGIKQDSKKDGGLERKNYEKTTEKTIPIKINHAKIRNIDKNDKDKNIKDETDKDRKYEGITDKVIETTNKNLEKDDNSNNKQTGKLIKSNQPVVSKNDTATENTEKDKPIKTILLDKTTKDDYRDGNDNEKQKTTITEIIKVSKADDKNVTDKTTVNKKTENVEKETVDITEDTLSGNNDKSGLINSKNDKTTEKSKPNEVDTTVNKNSDKDSINNKPVEENKTVLKKDDESDVIGDDGDNNNDDDENSYEDEVDEISETEKAKKLKDGKYVLINKNPVLDNQPRNGDDNEETTNAINKVSESNNTNVIEKITVSKKAKNEKETTVNETKKLLDSNDKSNKIDSKDDKTTEKSKPIEDVIKNADKGQTVLKKDNQSDVVDDNNNVFVKEINKIDTDKKSKDGKDTSINKTLILNNEPKNGDNDEKTINEIKKVSRTDNNNVTDKPIVSKQSEIEIEKTDKKNKKVLESNDKLSNPIDSKNDTTTKNGNPVFIDTAIIEKIDKDNGKNNKTVLKKDDRSDVTDKNNEKNTKPVKLNVTENITEIKNELKEDEKGNDKNKKPAKSIVDKANQINHIGRPNATDEKIDKTINKFVAVDKTVKDQNTSKDISDNYKKEAKGDDITEKSVVKKTNVPIETPYKIETDEEKPASETKKSTVNYKPSSLENRDESDVAKAVIKQSIPKMNERDASSKEVKSDKTFGELQTEIIERGTKHDEKDQTVKRPRNVSGSEDNENDLSDDDTYEDEVDNDNDGISKIKKVKISGNGKYNLINKKPVLDNKPKDGDDDKKPITEIKKVSETDIKNVTDETIVSENTENVKEKFVKDTKQVLETNDKSNPFDSKSDKTTKNGKPIVINTTIIKNPSKDSGINNKTVVRDETVLKKDVKSDINDKDTKPVEVNVTGNITEIKKGLKKDDKDNDKNRKPVKSIVDIANKINNTTRPEVNDKTIDGSIKTDQTTKHIVAVDKTAKDRPKSVGSEEDDQCNDEDCDNDTNSDDDKNDDDDDTYEDEVDDDNDEISKNVKDKISEDGKFTLINKKPVINNVFINGNDNEKTITEIKKVSVTDKKNVTDETIVSKNTENVKEKTVKETKQVLETNDKSNPIDSKNNKTTKSSKPTVINTKIIENSYKDSGINNKTVDRNGTVLTDVIDKDTKPVEANVTGNITEIKRGLEKDDKGNDKNRKPVKSIADIANKINNTTRPRVTDKTIDDSIKTNKTTTKIVAVDTTVQDRPKSVGSEDDEPAKSVVDKANQITNTERTNTTDKKVDDTIKNDKTIKNIVVVDKTAKDKPESVAFEEDDQCIDEDCDNGNNSGDDKSDDDDSCEDEVDDDNDEISKTDKTKKSEGRKYTLINKKPVITNEFKKGKDDKKTIIETKKVSETDTKYVTDKTVESKITENAKEKSVKETKQVLETNDKSNPIDSKNNRTTKNVKPVFINTTIIKNSNKDSGINNKTVDRNKTVLKEDVQSDVIDKDTKPVEANVTGNITEIKRGLEKDDKGNDKNRKPGKSIVDIANQINNTTSPKVIDKTIDDSIKTDKTTKKIVVVDKAVKGRPKSVVSEDNEPAKSVVNKTNQITNTGRTNITDKRVDDTIKNDKTIRNIVAVDETAKYRPNSVESEEDDQCIDGDCDNDNNSDDDKNDDDDSYEDEFDDDNDKTSENVKDKISEDGKYTLINKKPVINNEFKNGTDDKETIIVTKKVSETDTKYVTDKTVVSKITENEKEKSVKETKQVLETNDKSNPIYSKNDKITKNGKPIVLNTTIIKNSDNDTDKNNKTIDQNKTILKTNDRSEVADKNEDRNTKPLKPNITRNITEIKKGLKDDDKGNVKNKKPAKSIDDKANQIINTGKPKVTEEKTVDIINTDKTIKHIVAVDKTAKDRPKSVDSEDDDLCNDEDCDNDNNSGENDDDDSYEDEVDDDDNDEISETDKDKKLEDGKYTLINKKPVINNEFKNGTDDKKSITEIKKALKTDEKNVTDITVISKITENEKQKSITEVKQILETNDNPNPNDSKNDKTIKNGKSVVIDATVIKTSNKISGINNKTVDRNETVLKKDVQLDVIDKNTKPFKPIITGNITDIKKELQKDDQDNDKNQKPVKSIVDKANQIIITGRPKVTDEKIDDTIKNDKTIKNIVAVDKTAKDRPKSVDSKEDDQCIDEDCDNDYNSGDSKNDDDDSYEDEVDDDNDEISETDRDEKSEDGKNTLINKKSVINNELKNGTDDKKSITEIKQVLETDEKNVIDKTVISKKSENVKEKSVTVIKQILETNDKPTRNDSKNDTNTKNGKPVVIDTTVIKEFDKDTGKNNKTIDQNKTILKKDDRTEVVDKNEDRNTKPLKPNITGNITEIKKGLEQDEKGNVKNKEPVKSIDDKANQIINTGKPKVTEEKTVDIIKTDKAIKHIVVVDKTAKDRPKSVDSEDDDLCNDEDCDNDNNSGENDDDDSYEDEVDDDDNDEISETGKDKISEDREYTLINKKPVINNEFKNGNDNQKTIIEIKKVSEIVKKNVTDKTIVSKNPENVKEKSVTVIKQSLKTKNKPNPIDSKIDKTTKNGKPIVSNTAVIRNYDEDDAKNNKTVDKNKTVLKKNDRPDVIDKNEDKNTKPFKPIITGNITDIKKELQKDDQGNDKNKRLLKSTVDKANQIKNTSSPTTTDKDVDDTIKNDKTTNKFVTVDKTTKDRPKGVDSEEDDQCIDEDCDNDNNSGGDKNVDDDSYEDEVDDDNDESSESDEDIILEDGKYTLVNKKPNNEFKNGNDNEKTITEIKKDSVTDKKNVTDETVVSKNTENVKEKSVTVIKQSLETKNNPNPIDSKNDKPLKNVKPVVSNTTVIRNSDEDHGKNYKTVDKNKTVLKNDDRSDVIDKNNDKNTKPVKPISTENITEIKNELAKNDKNNDKNKKPAKSVVDKANQVKNTGKTTTTDKSVDDTIKNDETIKNIVVVDKTTKDRPKSVDSEEDDQCIDGDCDNNNNSDNDNDADDSYEDEFDDDNDKISENDQDKISEDGKYTLINKKPVINNEFKNGTDEKESITEIKKALEIDEKNVTDKTVASKKTENEKEKSVTVIIDKPNPIDNKNDKTTKNGKPVVIDTTVIKTSDKISDINNKTVDRNKTVLKKDDRSDVIDKNNDKNTKPGKPIITGNITEIKKELEKDDKGNDKNKKPAKPIVDKANQIKNTGIPTTTDKKIDDTIKNDKTTNKFVTVDKTAEYKPKSVDSEEDDQCIDEDCDNGNNSGENDDDDSYEDEVDDDDNDEISETDKNKKSEDGKYTLINEKPVINNEFKKGKDDKKTIIETKKVSETDIKNVTDKTFVSKNTENVKEKSVTVIKQILETNDKPNPIDSKNDKTTINGKPVVIDTTVIKTSDKISGINNKTVDRNKTVLKKDDRSDVIDKNNDKNTKPGKPIITENITIIKNELEKGDKNNDRNKKLAKSIVDKANQIKNEEGAFGKPDKNRKPESNDEKNSKTLTNIKKEVVKGKQDQQNDRETNSADSETEEDFNKYESTKNNESKKGESISDDNTYSEEYDDDDDDDKDNAINRSDKVKKSIRYGGTKYETVKKFEKDLELKKQKNDRATVSAYTKNDAILKNKKPSTFEKATPNEDQDEGDEDWWYYNDKDKKTQKSESNGGKDKKAIGSEIGQKAVSSDNGDQNKKDDDISKPDNGNKPARNKDNTQNISTKIGTLATQKGQKNNNGSQVSDKTADKLDWLDNDDDSSNENYDDDDNDEANVFDKSSKPSKYGNGKDKIVRRSKDSKDSDIEDRDENGDKERQIVKKELTIIVSKKANKNENNEDDKDWWYYNKKDEKTKKPESDDIKDKKAIQSGNEGFGNKYRGDKVDGTEKSGIGGKPARNDKSASESSDKNGDDDDDSYEYDLSDESEEEDQSEEKYGNKNKKFEGSGTGDKESPIVKNELTIIVSAKARQNGNNEDEGEKNWWYYNNEVEIPAKNDKGARKDDFVSESSDESSDYDYVGNEYDLSDESGEDQSERNHGNKNKNVDGSGTDSTFSNVNRKDIGNRNKLPTTKGDKKSKIITKIGTTVEQKKDNKPNSANVSDKKGNNDARKIDYALSTESGNEGNNKTENNDTKLVETKNGKVSSKENRHDDNKTDQPGNDTKPGIIGIQKYSTGQIGQKNDSSKASENIETSIDGKSTGDRKSKDDKVDETDKISRSKNYTGGSEDTEKPLPETNKDVESSKVNASDLKDGKHRENGKIKDLPKKIITVIKPHKIRTKPYKPIQQKNDNNTAPVNNTASKNNNENTGKNDSNNKTITVKIVGHKTVDESSIEDYDIETSEDSESTVAGKQSKNNKYNPEDANSNNNKSEPPKGSRNHVVSKDKDELTTNTTSTTDADASKAKFLKTTILDSKNNSSKDNESDKELKSNSKNDSETKTDKPTDAEEQKHITSSSKNDDTDKKQPIAIYTNKNRKTDNGYKNRNSEKRTKTTESTTGKATRSEDGQGNIQNNEGDENYDEESGTLNNKETSDSQSYDNINESGTSLPGNKKNDKPNTRSDSSENSNDAISRIESGESSSEPNSSSEEESITKDGNKTVYEKSLQDKDYSEEKEDSKFTEEPADFNEKTVQSDQRSASEIADKISSDDYAEEFDGNGNSTKKSSSSEDERNQVF